MATTFVIINYGENEELLINPNCRQLIFMGYLRGKCQYDSKAFIDLLDENGKLANVHMVDPQENLSPNFQDRLIYIPCMLEKSGDERAPLKMVKPLLTDWEKKFPQLERKIKILTGEVKRKKSPAKGILDPRGRSVDRKSSSNKADGMGRSTSNMGRPSSIASQTGRLSTTNARKSAMGKMDKIESGKTTGKGKGKKK